MSERPDPADLHRWAQALAGIARTGLGFTDSTFESERYEEILHIASDIAAAAEGVDNPEDQSRMTADEAFLTWKAMVSSGVAGYSTPKVAVGAIVGDDKGRLLLIKRADSGLWLYPTGWADVGYSPAEVVVKEVQEETGIRCEVKSLIGVIDGLRAGFSRVPLYSLLFYCRAIGGEISAHPLECIDAGWFGADELPTPMIGYERWGNLAFDAIAGKSPAALFDAPREPVWRQPTDSES